MRYNLGHLELFTPNSEKLGRALDFITYSTDFYSDERHREAALKCVLGGLFPGTKAWQEPTREGKTRPYGLWLEGRFGYVLVELKNEPGLSGDPSLQALIAYGKFIAGEVPFVPHPTISLR